MSYQAPTVFVNSTLQRPHRGTLNIQISLPDYEWDRSTTRYDLKLLKQVISMDSRWSAVVGEIFDSRTKAYVNELVKKRMAELVRMGLLHCWGGKWHFDPQDAADEEIYCELKQYWPDARVAECFTGDFNYCFYEVDTDKILGYGQLHNGPITAGPDMEYLDQRIYVDVVGASNDRTTV